MKEISKPVAWISPWSLGRIKKNDGILAKIGFNEMVSNEQNDSQTVALYKHPVEVSEDMVRRGISAYEDATGGRLPDGGGEDHRIVRLMLETALGLNDGK